MRKTSGRRDEVLVEKCGLGVGVMGEVGGGGGGEREGGEGGGAGGGGGGGVWGKEGGEG